MKLIQVAKFLTYVNVILKIQIKKTPQLEKNIGREENCIVLKTTHKIIKHVIMYNTLYIITQLQNSYLQ
jgi:hypothetical protein